MWGFMSSKSIENRNRNTKEDILKKCRSTNSGWTPLTSIVWRKKSTIEVNRAYRLLLTFFKISHFVLKV